MDGNIELGNIVLLNVPMQMVNNVIQTTTLPIEYTVKPGKLYDGKSSKIHISKIDNKEQNPPIALVVTENNNIAIQHNPPFISINKVKYTPEKIIPTASV